MTGELLALLTDDGPVKEYPVLDTQLLDNSSSIGGSQRLLTI